MPGEQWNDGLRSASGRGAAGFSECAEGQTKDLIWRRWKAEKMARWRQDFGMAHGRIEMYDSKGNHLGEFDPETGAMVKEADPTRKVEP
jgi:hypothetical protein